MRGARPARLRRAVDEAVTEVRPTPALPSRQTCASCVRGWKALAAVPRLRASVNWPPSRRGSVVRGVVNARPLSAAVRRGLSARLPRRSRSGPAIQPRRSGRRDLALLLAAPCRTEALACSDELALRLAAVVLAPGVLVRTALLLAAPGRCAPARTWTAGVDRHAGCLPAVVYLVAAGTASLYSSGGGGARWCSPGAGWRRAPRGDSEAIACSAGCGRQRAVLRDAPSSSAVDDVLSATACGAAGERIAVDGVDREAAPRSTSRADRREPAVDRPPAKVATGALNTTPIVIETTRRRHTMRRRSFAWSRTHRPPRRDPAAGRPLAAVFVPIVLASRGHVIGWLPRRAARAAVTTPSACWCACLRARLARRRDHRRTGVRRDRPDSRSGGARIARTVSRRVRKRAVTEGRPRVAAVSAARHRRARVALAAAVNAARRTRSPRHCALPRRQAVAVRRDRHKSSPARALRLPGSEAEANCSRQPAGSADSARLGAWRTPREQERAGHVRGWRAPGGQASTA